jgi:hypothetical protein
VPDVPALLQPVAHALLQAVEDVGRASALLRPEDLWVSPGNAATAGFHLKHLAGATDRLFTYARGEALADAQRAALAAESVSGPAGVTTALLLAELRRVVDGALAQLGATPIEYLTTQRLIGRAQRPSTVLGCLFHAAEHAARHAGQFVTTVRVLNR